MEVPKSADTPYHNVLVIALFESFDMRMKLEKDVVNQLVERGVEAVASTSMMTTKTPVTRQVFAAMAEELGSDAVLVTRFADVNAKVKMKDMNPQTSYKVSPADLYYPTYYYNVWEVKVEEYVEPPKLELKGKLVLATQMFSVMKREVVWAIESKSKLALTGDPGRNYTLYLDEAAAIAKHMSKDGLIAK